MIKIPKSFDKKLYICLGVGKYTHGNISIGDYNRAALGDLGDGYQYVLLKTIRVSGDIEANEGDVVSAIIKSLRATKEIIIQEYEAKLSKIDEQIKDTLALEYKR